MAVTNERQTHFGRHKHEAVWCAVAEACKECRDAGLQRAAALCGEFGIGLGGTTSVPKLSRKHVALRD